MEIDQKINQYNAFGEHHGYWNDDDPYYSVMCHYFNQNRFGYCIEDNSFAKWNCHYINDKEIGCELQYRLLHKTSHQYYFKAPNQKFGEEIRWK